jgi:hypothetical protein
MSGGVITLAEVARLLAEVTVGLQQIHSTVTVAVAALRQQASGLDEDIATVLVRGAADRLQDQIEKLEAASTAIIRAP